ncbi:MAG TPA: hypothetical protein VJN43_09455 [Bryobacteraceae bacterium]|nr:hypothetical protein [Bryobacteraceae bacterium]
MKRYGKFTAWLIAIWFILAALASAFGLYANSSSRLGYAVGVSALAPIALFALWYARSEGFRRFALSLNPRALTFIHSWRIAGIVFVILEAYGVLPAIFALPAGYGDMFIGATAWLVAWKLAVPRHRASFIFWQLLGSVDLVMAVTLGTTARLLSPQGVSMAAMTALPLSLVPTFLVPLLFILHLVCIAQARRWSRVSSIQPETAAGSFGSGSHPRPVAG